MIDFISKGQSTKDATVNDVIYPKTAYVNGEKITGNIIINKKPLELSNYNLFDPNYQNIFTEYDLLEVSDIYFVAGTVNDILYLYAYNTENILIAENQFSLSSILSFNDVNDFAICLDSIENNYIYIYSKTIRDGITNNIFFSLIPDASVFGQYTVGAIFKINWNTSTGTITSVHISRASLGTIDFEDTIYQTGNGQFLVIGSKLLKIDTSTMSYTIIGSYKVYISHNMSYVVYDNKLYKINYTGNFETDFNNKLMIAQLPNNLSGNIYFSKDDRYIICYNNNAIYIYTYTDNEILLFQTLNISTSSHRQIFNTYKLLFKNSNTQKINIEYCIENNFYIFGLNYDSDLFFKPETENVPNNTMVLNGIKYYNVDGNIVHGTMPNNGELNYTPSISEQSIPEGYTNGGTISAVDNTIDSNIIASNIKSGITILGITGTLEEGTNTTDADATSSDIVSGKTAYVNGEKIIGNVQEVTTYIYDIYTGAEFNPGGALLIKSNIIENALYRPGSIKGINLPTSKFAEFASVIGLTADKIKAGETILGITGTYAGEGDEIVEEG